MSGQRVHAARDRPDVQIVNVADAGNAYHVAYELGDIDILGSRFHEDIDRLSHQIPSAPGDEDRDRKRNDGVRCIPSRQQNREAGDDDPDRSGDVSEHVQHRRANVETRGAMAALCVANAVAGLTGKPLIASVRPRSRATNDALLRLSRGYLKLTRYGRLVEL